MKSSEWLMESNVVGIRQGLVDFVKKTKGFQPLDGGYYLFVWTPEAKNGLLRSGAKSNIVDEAEIDNLGIGVVNINTGEVALFGIDGDYEVGGISSMGPFDDATSKRFFKDISMYDDILDGLEHLARQFKKLGIEQEDDRFKRISKELWDWGDNELQEVADDFDVLELEDLDDAKSKLEQMVLAAQNKISRKRMELKRQQEHLAKLEQQPDVAEKIYSRAYYHEIELGNEVLKLENTITELPKFLNANQDLFDDEKNKKTDKERETRENIDKWAEKLHAQFPKLKFNDVYDFDPNKNKQETEV